eukprot:1502118-Amphidinium_carterae.1
MHAYCNDKIANSDLPIRKVRHQNPEHNVANSLFNSTIQATPHSRVYRSMQTVADSASCRRRARQADLALSLLSSAGR